MTQVPTDGLSAALYDADSYRAAGFFSPDVYFTPGYGQAEAIHGAGAWYSVVAFDGLWQLPIHVRDLDGIRDAVTPYGYSGIYASPDLSPRDREDAWRGSCAVLAEQGLLSLFLRQSPLLERPFDEAPGQRVVAGHQTVLLATGSADEAWSAMQGRSRTSIRKAERDGYVASLRPAEPADFKPSSPFRLLYEGAMKNRDASPRYFFTDAYYQTLLDGLGASLLLGVGRNADDTAVCAALFMRHDKTLHYHLSGSDVDAGRAGATNQLIWAAMCWAAASGVKSLHLGGGVSSGDSLFKFKRSFGGQVLEYDAYGVVLDQPLYASAVRERARSAGLAEADVMHTGYFPAYRAAV